MTTEPQKTNTETPLEKKLDEEILKFARDFGASYPEDKGLILKFVQYGSNFTIDFFIDNEMNLLESNQALDKELLIFSYKQKVAMLERSLQEQLQSNKRMVTELITTSVRLERAIISNKELKEINGQLSDNH